MEIITFTVTFVAETIPAPSPPPPLALYQSSLSRPTVWLQRAARQRGAELGRLSKSAHDLFISPAVCRKVVDSLADCSSRR